MSTQVITSDLLVPLSTEEQQLLSGGQREEVEAQRFGGGFECRRIRRRYFRLRRCVRRCSRF
ncbi:MULTISPECIES: hypothetical protein [unclassified Anabaena]|uniref:hypothetical protein n=1 Tax=unclassified Anabaena TaxID=2619674 RepID=UPI000AAF6C75|nr:MULTISPECIES: hypothetical protein [unclassified Anabaena]